jgi:hypothetical protein
MYAIHHLYDAIHYMDMYDGIQYIFYYVVGYLALLIIWRNITSSNINEYRERFTQIMRYFEIDHQTVNAILLRVDPPPPPPHRTVISNDLRPISSLNTDVRPQRPRQSTTPGRRYKSFRNEILLRVDPPPPPPHRTVVSNDVRPISSLNTNVRPQRPPQSTTPGRYQSFRNGFRNFFKTSIKSNVKPNTVTKDDESRESLTLCIICMVTPINIFLSPCGHAEICNECSLKIDKCCTCRKSITKRTKLYSPFN